MRILSLIEGQEDWHGDGAYAVVIVIAVAAILTCYYLGVRYTRRKNPFYLLKMRIFKDPDEEQSNKKVLVQNRPGRSEESLIRKPIVEDLDDGKELPLVAKGQGRDLQY